MKRNFTGDSCKGECSYGVGCYRKNPIHFKEYSHKHLTEIINKTPQGNDFIIPQHLAASREILTEQLKILIDYNIVPQKKTRTDVVDSNSINTEFNSINTESSNSRDNSHTINTNTKQAPDNNISNSINSTSTSISNTEEADNNSNDKQASANSGSKRAGHKSAAEIFNVAAPEGKFADKLAAASPYNFFLTTITANPVTHTEPLSVTFTELLDRSLGELESSVQINFMVDLAWLLAHYVVSGNRDTQILILYGEETDELVDINKKSKNIQTVQVKMGSPFGKHHTKMSLLGYKDGSMRVVVSTANLYEDDWENRTQGLWISPKLPEMQTVWDTRVGESVTGFRDDLLRYLISYKIPQLQTWIARIRKTDFSAVNVFLVASVPGSHRGLDGSRYGHRRLANLLSSHACGAACSKDYVIAQSSSIGSLGPNKDSWVGGEFLTSTTRTKPRDVNADSSMRLLESRPLIKMIYPSLSNVRASHDGLMGGGCLPYNVKTHSKQGWLMTILHQWRSKSRNRSKAMPHIKSYCRVCIKDDKIAGLYWFLVTSANLSKAAWGVSNKTTAGSLTGDPPLRIMSYEAGVLFLPQFMIQKNLLPLEQNVESGPVFPMPFDLPLTQYNPDDTPFFMDLLVE